MGHKDKKTGVALLTRHRGHCEPLWAVIPPLQVVLSSACSVASLGRFPSHYLPGRLCLRPGVLADHLFGWGIPSTRQAGHVTVHSASSVKSPCGAQGGMTLPNEDWVWLRAWHPFCDARFFLLRRSGQSSVFRRFHARPRLNLVSAEWSRGHAAAVGVAARGAGGGVDVPRARERSRDAPAGRRSALLGPAAGNAGASRPACGGLLSVSFACRRQGSNQ